MTNPPSAQFYTSLSNPPSHKLILQCNGRSQEEMLCAAVAVGPVRHAKKLGTDRIEVDLELPDSVLERTGGDTQYRLNVTRMLHKLDGMHTLLPNLMHDPLAHTPQEGQIAIRKERLTGRHLITVYFGTETEARQFIATMGNQQTNYWRVTTHANPRGQTSYRVESAPSSVIYLENNAHNTPQRQAVNLAMQMLDKTIYRMVTTGEINKPILHDGVTVDNHTGKLYLRVSFRDPGYKLLPKHRRSAEKSAKSLWKKLGSLCGMGMEHGRLVEVKNGVSLLIDYDFFMEIGQKALQEQELQRTSSGSIPTLMMPSERPASREQDGDTRDTSLLQRLRDERAQSSGERIAV